MACVNCGKIRSAILHGKMAEAAGLTVEVFRDKIGLTPKGDPRVDVATLPSLSGKTKAELLAIAEAEGVTVEDGASNADIVKAIEAHRGLVAA